MASPSIDVNAIGRFILHWVGAGLCGAVGWALSVTYVIPHLPLP